MDIIPVHLTKAEKNERERERKDEKISIEKKQAQNPHLPL